MPRSTRNATMVAAAAAAMQMPTYAYASVERRLDSPMAPEYVSAHGADFKSTLAGAVVAAEQSALQGQSALGARRLPAGDGRQAHLARRERGVRLQAQPLARLPLDLVQAGVVLAGHEL